MSRDTNAPILDVGRDSRIKLPLALLWAIVLTAALAGGYVYTLRGEVSQHTVEIAEVRAEVRASRELLVRIDENVKQLKETAGRK